MARFNIKLANALIVMLLLLVMLSSTIIATASPPMPSRIYGYIIYNGSGVNGVIVTLIQSNGFERTYTTHNDASNAPGYFQFGSTQGNTYTISVTYENSTRTLNVTVPDSMDDDVGTIDLSPAPTPTPTTTPTPTPTPEIIVCTSSLMLPLLAVGAIGFSQFGKRRKD